jgi:hypothetical protein
MELQQNYLIFEAFQLKHLYSLAHSSPQKLRPLKQDILFLAYRMDNLEWYKS